MFVCDSAINSIFDSLNKFVFDCNFEFISLIKFILVYVPFVKVIEKSSNIVISVGVVILDVDVILSVIEFISSVVEVET